MKQENLFKALGLFIEAMRPYIVSTLKKNAGEEWVDWYYESLNFNQRENWKQSIDNGSNSESLIDFHNLKGFALKYKDLLKSDFGRKSNSLATWFDYIAEVRHKCQHFLELDDIEVQKAYSNMIIIAKELKMDELEKELISLQYDKKQEEKKKKVVVKKTKKDTSGLIPWFKNVIPHMDIRQGHLDESVFAANLAEVALGSGREIYLNPAIFFTKTFFTSGLKTVANRVIKGLSGGEDAENRVISLQTGFGGGKTHVLISSSPLLPSLVRKQAVNPILKN